MTVLSDRQPHHARILVVLCDTQLPANIGAAARAMKTMGLHRLALVRPAQFPHGHADKLAVSAVDVIEQAHCHADLATAIVGCHAVYGISARQRRIPVPTLSPRELGPQAWTDAQLGEVALVFGGEEAGLSTADLSLCDRLVQIPSHPDCRSLNLAAAVQVVCYELRAAELDVSPPTAQRSGAPRAEFARWFDELDTALQDSGYYANKNHELSRESLRRSLQRAAFDRPELRMLHGVLRALRGKG